MSRTPWTRASSVPSDRIPSTNTSQTSRSKGKSKITEPPKSKEVLRLEDQIENLKGPSDVKDPKGGCFCQARMHPLSKYTPLCMQCGLVLCSLQAPHYACPHCASALLSSSSRDALIQELTSEIKNTMIREQEQRERDELERQRAAGAFPALSTSSESARAPSSGQPRKVLSLNSQTKKVTLASYMPASTTHNSKAEDLEPEEKRKPPPPKGVDFVTVKSAERGRWENLRSGRIYYVPPPTQDTGEGSGPGRGRRRKKKGAEIDRS